MRRCTSQSRSIKSFINALSVSLVWRSPKLICFSTYFFKTSSNGSCPTCLRSDAQVSRKCLRSTNRFTDSSNSWWTILYLSSGAMSTLVLSIRTLKGSSYTCETANLFMYALQWCSKFVFQFFRNESYLR